MKKWLLGIVGMLIIVGLLLGVWWLSREALSWITAQPTEIAGAIIAFVGTVTVGIGAVLISQQHSKNREIAESHRPKKTEIYSGFIKFTVDLMRNTKGKKGTDVSSPKKLEEFFIAFTTDVMLWGSPAVLRTYGKFRLAGQQENPNVILLVDDLLQAMRKDLGLSNQGLNRGDLIKMLLTDPEKLDAVIKEREGK